MRVTTQIFYEHFLSGLQQNIQAELKDSDQISSGKKISTPSDDPSTLWKIVDYQTQLSEIGQYQLAINSAKAPIQTLDTSLSDLNNNLTRANELAISAGNGTMDANNMLMISSEVKSLSDSVVSTANTQVDGRYIFAGYQSNVNPIDPTTGEFISDTNSFNIGIANGVNVSANISAGSLVSFKRVNTTDSATGILPTYNWTNSGANTIPDADPTSALQTASGSFVDSNVSSFTANGGSLTVQVGTNSATSSGGFVINNTNDVLTIGSVAKPAITDKAYNGAGLATALSGLVAGLDFSYDNTAHKFTVTNTTVAPITVNFSASSEVAKILGFDPLTDKTISAGGSVTSDNAVGDVNLAKNSTLQDVRDAFNTAGAGVKAEVVNEGTATNPDFRLVIASNPAGSSDKIDISVLSKSIPGDSSGPPPTGIYMLSYDKTTGNNMTLGTNITNYNYITEGTANNSIVIDDGTAGGGVANNQIVVNEQGFPARTIPIARGTYTPGQLAAKIQTALNDVNPADSWRNQSPNGYLVTYDPNAKKFKIAQTNTTTGVAVDFRWDDPNSTARQLLGFNAAKESILAIGGSDQSDNSVIANYYSFNNNYLNDTNILRALNFENEALKNSDRGRIGQSLKYTGDLSDAVSQTQAAIGARENQITLQSNFQTTTSTNVQTFLSSAQDTDIAKASTDLAQREAALQALRTISAQVLNKSLFDYLKF